MKNRNKSLKKVATTVWESIKFRYSILSLQKQVAILGVILSLVSLFFPWIIQKDPVLQWNAFSALTGNIGYMLVILLCITLFFIVSNSQKENLKLYANIWIKTHNLVLTSGSVLLLLSIILISFSVGLQAFSQEISYGRGPIVAIIGGILMITAGVLIQKENSENDAKIILAKMNEEREKTKHETNKKKNMELPF